MFNYFRYLNNKIKQDNRIKKYFAKEKQFNFNFFITEFPFSVNSVYLEQKNDKISKINLALVARGEKTKLTKEFRKKIKFINGPKLKSSELEKILERHKNTNSDHVMVLADEKELFYHIQKIYDVSYANYTLAKENNIHNGLFPICCCGFSSINMFLNLIENGYLGVAIFYNGAKDHMYNGIPFIMEGKNKKGFIIIDSTSDQIYFKNNNNYPKNYIFITSGEKWKYFNEKGEDLFPNEKDSSQMLNLMTLRNNSLNQKKIFELSKNTDKYLKEVFEKTKVINTDLNK